MIGKTISHYRILDKLGEGGMGVVYKAEDLRLRRTVALKFISPQAMGGGAERARFVHEAQAAAVLAHPNICVVFEIDEADRQSFIAMECVEGESLKDKIDAGPLKLAEALDIACQMAAGLRAAHEKGIVHRDIKPANIMLTGDGLVKILDFGLARSAEQTRITRTGTTMGTVTYMSPEQARGEMVDQRTDIWSLGVVLYEMLSGCLPFRGDHEQATLYLILNEEPGALGDRRAELPGEFERITGKALAKNPQQRYQQMREFQEDLKCLGARLSQEIGAEAPLDTRSAPSIAVLPFTNMSPDPENEYFGDGLAEELINALAQINGLRVTARTSAFRFRGQAVDIREIGEKLNVSSVLEGSVRQAGNRLRITAQLIDVADGYHLWSDRYDREMADIFAIQDEIATAIVGQLEAKLLPMSAHPLVKSPTDDLEAYSLYLKGRYYWNMLTMEGYEKSYQYYQQAIEKDPHLGLAYSGLAVHHGSQAFWGNTAPHEAFPRSRELAEKALRIDDSDALAHSILAIYYFGYEWDRAAAEREFERSLTLDSSSAITHFNYALYSLIHGHQERGLQEARIALQLDPLSALTIAWAGLLPAYVGRYEDAVLTLQNAVDLEPEYWQPYHSLVLAHLYGGRLDQAAVAAEKAVQLSQRASIALCDLAWTFILRGQNGEAEGIWEELQERAERAYVAPTFFMWIKLAAGEVDEARSWLAKVLEQRDPWIHWHALAPPQVRTRDPRFCRILEDAGLA